MIKTCHVASQYLSVKNFKKHFKYNMSGRNPSLTDLIGDYLMVTSLTDNTDTEQGEDMDDDNDYFITDGERKYFGITIASICYSDHSETIKFTKFDELINRVAYIVHSFRISVECDVSYKYMLNRLRCDDVVFPVNMNQTYSKIVDIVMVPSNVYIRPDVFMKNLMTETSGSYLLEFAADKRIYTRSDKNYLWYVIAIQNKTATPFNEMEISEKEAFLGENKKFMFTNGYTTDKNNNTRTPNAVVMLHVMSFAFDDGVWFEKAKKIYSLLNEHEEIF